MAKVRIVTDSTADIPKELIEKYDIGVVPLNVHIEDEVYKDKVNLSSEEFFEKLTKAKNLPRTSQPSPGDFIELYRNVSQDSDTIISIHLSEHLSGTIQSAKLAADSMEGMDITLIDSKLVCMGLGLIVLEGAKAAAAGMDKEEVLQVIEDAKRRVQVIFVVDTMEYLEKNGRIGKAQAFLGSILSIKPILSFDDGIIIPVDKFRGTKKALSNMVKIARSQIKGNSIRGALVDGVAPDKIEFMKEELNKVFTNVDMSISPVGPVIGVHSGPGVIGFMYFLED